MKDLTVPTIEKVPSPAGFKGESGLHAILVDALEKELQHCSRRADRIYTICKKYGLSKKQVLKISPACQEEKRLTEVLRKARAKTC
ncbi:MAG: hypothetical protein JWQ07_4039 [Ramlibacter sp.]|nr:hypothetical protein [Ramlibacter sp.]